MISVVHLTNLVFLFQIRISVNILKNIRVPTRDVCAICHAVSSVLSLDNGLATMPLHVGRPAIAADFGVSLSHRPTHGHILMIRFFSCTGNDSSVSPS